MRWNQRHGLYSFRFVAVPFAFGIVASFAQAPPAAMRPKLEVASIKPSLPGGGFIGARVDGDRISLQNYPLRDMVMAAYGVRSSELFGGPSWIGGALYDVVAKADKPADRRALWRMMQSLLEDRFRLKLHHESREMPVINIYLANAGKLDRLRGSSCIDADPTAPLPQPVAGQPALPRCGTILFGPAKPAGVQLLGSHIHMSGLAQRLTDILGRRVFDKTGFDGTFDLSVKFVADFAVHGIPDQERSRLQEPADQAGLPSLYSVLHDQLGLKLQAAKGMIDVLVIDGIDRPSGN
jgi:uncharacterized protein (TIGR03435 family)